MEIKYSKHLKTRIVLRKVDHNLPRRIYESAKERFIDNNTGHLIAVKKEKMYGKIRDVMVAYKYEGIDIKLLTIHPLKKGQKGNRIKSGRWRKI
jgi:hypothetical protein